MIFKYVNDTENMTIGKLALQACVLLVLMFLPHADFKNDQLILLRTAGSILYGMMVFVSFVSSSILIRICFDILALTAIICIADVYRVWINTHGESADN